MAGPRTYGQRCGASHALDLVGERWALLIVRELLLGPKRFTDLKKGVQGASPNVLAQRLRELEEAGVVRRTELPPPAASRVYELTEWGRELEDAMLALGRWGVRSPLFPAIESDVGLDSIVLALKTLFDPSAADRMKAEIELRLRDQRFRVRIARGRIEAERGEAFDPDAVIATDPETLSAVLWEGRSPGDLQIEGDRETVERFLGLFPLPEPAAAV